MAIVRIGEIGETWAALEIVNDEIIGVTIFNARQSPPRLIVYRPNGTIRAQIVPLPGQGATAIINPPISISRIIADATVHGGQVVGQEILVLPSLAFIEI